MSFANIQCQDRAINALQKAYAGDRVAHAVIFTGPDGVGRFLTAAAWSRLLLCPQPVTTGSHQGGCGVCDSCKLFDAGTHPDFQHVYKELLAHTDEGKGRAAPIDLPIAVVREFLIGKVARKPTLSPCRVFVISEAEKLNAAGQNALLKILEEPPASCRIILLCTRLERLLPTIRSRAQTIRFGPIDRAMITKQLHQAGLAEDKAPFLAALSQGSLGLALTYRALDTAGADLFAIKKSLVTGIAQLSLAGVPALAQTCQDGVKTLAEAWIQVAKDTSKSDLTRRAQKTLIQVFITFWDDAAKWGIVPATEATHSDQQNAIAAYAGRFDTTEAAERVTWARGPAANRGGGQ